MKNTARILLVVFALFTAMKPLLAQWIQTGLTNNQVNTLAVSGTNLYAGASTSMSGRGFFRSTDNGTSWTTATTGLTDTSIYTLAVSGTNLFAGTDGGVFLSTDSGTSWTAVSNGLTNTYLRALAVSGTNVFAGTSGGGVFRSTNTGATWTEVNNGLTNPFVYALAVSGTNLFAGTYYAGIFLSTDTGANWTAVNPGKEIRAFAVSGTKVFAGSDSGVSLSTNNGTSWTRINSGLPPFTTVLALAVSGTNLFAGTDGGVFLSTNTGATWTEVNSGLTNTYVRALAFSGTNIFAGTFGDGVWRRAVNIPAPPTLLSPINEGTNQPTTLTLSWHESIGAENYRLQMATDSLFGNIVFNDSTIVDTFALVGPLLNYSEYSWQVSPINLTGPGTHSEIWRFRTIVGSPNNVTANANNQGITINWSAAGAGVLRYRIYRGVGAPTFGLLDSVLSNTTTYTDSGLSNGTPCYYRLTAVDSQLVEGDFSNVVSATPFNQPPTAVTLSDVNIPNAGRTLTTELTFSSAGSFDPDGTIDSIFWYVDDIPVGRQQEMTHHYGPGTTRVMLIVQDNNDASDTVTAKVTRSVFKVPLNGPIYAGLSLLGDSLLYAVATGDAIYRLDIDSNILYTLQVGGNVLSASSVAYDTTVYIASTDRNLYAFSGLGVPVWPALPLGGALSATPAIDSLANRLYIGVQNRNFIAVNRTTGLVAWSYFSDAPITNSAVITSDRKLVFSTQRGTVYGFDLANLPSPVSPSWTLALGDTITSSPAIDAGGYFYVGTKSGKIAKISMQQGAQASIVWQTPTGSPVYASPIIDGRGVLYVGSLDSNFYAINTTSGGVNWLFRTAGPIHSTAAVSNSGIIYFGNDAGQLYAIDSLGNVEWQYLHSAPISAPLLYHKGTLYVGAEDGTVLAFFDGEDPFAEPPMPVGGSPTHKTNVARVPVWGTFQGNNQRTGVQIIQISTDVANNLPMLPTKYFLSQNYPNPFNPTTTIGYQLAAAGRVQLSIFNILGEEIARLVEGNYAAGYYSAVRDAGAAPSGIYFARIAVTGSSRNELYRRVTKLLLMK